MLLKDGRKITEIVKKMLYLCKNMRSIKTIWQQWRSTVMFVAWGMTVALVCFLLYRVSMNRSTTYLTPLSEGARDSLMTVAVPHGMSDTLVRYGGTAFDVHFNSERGIANCAA